MCRDVAAPGQYWTTEIAGEPVAVLRDKDGRLRALSNVCRHRAAQILSGEGSCPKVLRCPYHGWTYRQDGQLAAVPEARGFDNLDREAVRLPEFRVGELSGLVFVCMSDETEALDTYFGDLPDKLARLRLAELTASRRYPAAYDHNWKVIADNYLEGYHIPVGHPGLLRMLDYKRYLATIGKRHAWIDGPFRGKPSKNYQERLYQRLMRPMQGFPKELEGAWTYVHLWPATFIDIYPDQIDTWQLFPAGLRRTRTEARIYHSGSGAIRDRLVRDDQLAVQQQGDGRGRRALRRGAAGPGVAHVRAGCAEPQRERRAELPQPAARGAAGHRRGVSGSMALPARRRADPDGWLFLTPEVEREVPSLVDALHQGAADAEAQRIERLIHRGSMGTWFQYLRDVRGRLEQGVSAGADPELSRRLALILREQYLLVPALRPDDPNDAPELARLEELT